MTHESPPNQEDLAELVRKSLRELKQRQKRDKNVQPTFYREMWHRPIRTSNRLIWIVFIPQEDTGLLLVDLTIESEWFNQQPTDDLWEKQLINWILDFLFPYTRSKDPLSLFYSMFLPKFYSLSFASPVDSSDNRFEKIYTSLVNRLSQVGYEQVFKHQVKNF